MHLCIQCPESYVIYVKYNLKHHNTCRELISLKIPYIYICLATLELFLKVLLSDFKVGIFVI